jgi:competence protein ComEA
MLKEIYQKYILRYYKLFIIIGLVITFSGLGFGIIYYLQVDKKVESKNLTVDILEKESEQKTVPITYYVDLKGAVVTPNVYQVAEGSRIVDVIKMAGGLTDQADTSILNLSKKISDEMVIIIYTKDELNRFREANKKQEEIIKYVEEECKCPDPNVNNACINVENQDDNDTAALLSINTATKDDLMTLPGIGESKAQSIIDYRDSNGTFQIIDDIKNVTGIGESIFDKIKDLITV